MSNPSPFVNDEEVRRITFGMKLPAGIFNMQWVDTKTRTIMEEFKVNHAGNVYQFFPPAFIYDIALKITKSNS